MKIYILFFKILKINILIFQNLGKPWYKICKPIEVRFGSLRKDCNINKKSPDCLA